MCAKNDKWNTVLFTTNVKKGLYSHVITREKQINMFRGVIQSSMISCT